jgi:hypothetical protein
VEIQRIEPRRRGAGRRRAIERRNVVIAEIEASEVGPLDPDEAVQLTGLIALRGRSRGERFAPRRPCSSSARAPRSARVATPKRWSYSGGSRNGTNRPRLLGVSRGALVLLAQILLVVLAFVGEIYGGSLWFAVPPLLLAYLLYAARLGRRT